MENQLLYFLLKTKNIAKLLKIDLEYVNKLYKKVEKTIGK